MAYTDDAVKAKLSALNETQESIVTVAQWVMFHRYGYTFVCTVRTPSSGVINLPSADARQIGDMQTAQARYGYSASRIPDPTDAST